LRAQINRVFQIKTAKELFLFSTGVKKTSLDCFMMKSGEFFQSSNSSPDWLSIWDQIQPAFFLNL
jgi:hypothetical protein